MSNLRKPLKAPKFKSLSKVAREMGISRQLLEYRLAKGHVKPEDYEAVETFGKPYWAKDMRQTAKIGAHTFWREGL